MAPEQKATFCRICEPLCGMVATVEDGKIVQLRPDPEHPLSRGYACPKGIAMAEVQNDPDRVLHPLKRMPGGDFERVSWEQALTDIAARLRAHPARRHRLVHGQPGRLLVLAHALGQGLPRRARLAALLLGRLAGREQPLRGQRAHVRLAARDPDPRPAPDPFLLMVGANPLVSHGSVLSAPRIREQLLEIERVVVVDPRRTETARQFEHLPIRPDTDAQLLLSMLEVIFEEGLADRLFLERLGDGAAALERLAARASAGGDRGGDGVPAERVRELARDFAAADGAAAYGRTGSCLGRHGTLVAFLLDALNAVTGNLDRPGGAVFGRPPVALDDVGEQVGLATYGERRSRVGGFPDVIGNMPASLLPLEIETPGEGQIRALFVSAGQPGAVGARRRGARARARPARPAACRSTST